MALKKCPNCGKEISMNAFSCLHCGCQIERDNNEQNHPHRSDGLNNDVETTTNSATYINRKPIIIVLIIAVLIIGAICATRVYNQPMYDTMETIDKMVERQNRIENATDMKMLGIEKTLFEFDKTHLSYKKEQLSSAQLKKVNEYEKQKNLKQDPSDFTIPLKIEGTGLYTQGNYTYYEGTLKNQGDVPYYYVKVKATYQDRNEEILTTDWTYAVGREGIQPNESVQFKLMTAVRGDVKYGKLQILEWQ